MTCGPGAPGTRCWCSPRRAAAAVSQRRRPARLADIEGTTAGPWCCGPDFSPSRSGACRADRSVERFGFSGDISSRARADRSIRVPYAASKPPFLVRPAQPVAVSRRRRSSPGIARHVDDVRTGAFHLNRPGRHDLRRTGVSSTSRSHTRSPRRTDYRTRHVLQSKRPDRRDACARRGSGDASGLGLALGGGLWDQRRSQQRIELGMQPGAV